MHTHPPHTHTNIVFICRNSFNGRCNLCLDEKISIINFKNRELLLNKRNGLVFKCRHRGKFKLS